MAKGKVCRECNMPMYALKEEYQDKGSYVTYQCENGQCRQYKQPKRDYEEKR